MTSFLLTGPALEPISLDDAKTFLRVSDVVDDQLISTLIAAARVHVETLTRRAMITQIWRKVLDSWPLNNQVELPLGPFQNLVAVRVFDGDGNPTLLPLTQFVGEDQTAPARIILPRTINGQPNLRVNAAIEIDYQVGFGTGPDDVPEDLKQSLLTLIGHWYQHREAVVMAGSGAIVPLGFDQLIAPYKVMNL
ncbi:head-tail connector protein [Maritalea porphyrae]|uniref:head-tail connector protein n=1 Tax=Maritalea porphyrae TaxID=880732 RepID=UPI0022AE5B7E|nr:head-tail connector protein [Maritalea porphyrae]MCZ4271159.1 head-tail connector protein [Maritalea porphyrae]